MNYPYHVIRKRINGKDISIVGVPHNRLNFFKKNKALFESFVSQHDAAVIEQPVDYKYFWQCPFFGRIADIVHSQKKRVYQVDPANPLSSCTDVVAGVVGAKLTYEAVKSSIEKKVSRRDFLKGIGLAGLAGIGASLFFGSLPGFYLRLFINKESAYNYGLDDILTYGITDYRNIKIAEGIEKICHEVNDAGKIVAFHGVAHSRQIEAYLENPGLRKKKLAYLPYEAISSTKVREYAPGNGGWALARKF